MKVVVNRCFGGYCLSEAAYAELGLAWDKSGFAMEQDRANQKLIEAIEKLGRAASGECSKLEVVEIPDGIEWQIDSHDGFERVVEKHRWW